MKMAVKIHMEFLMRLEIFIGMGCRQVNSQTTISTKKMTFS